MDMFYQDDVPFIEDEGKFLFFALLYKKNKDKCNLCTTNNSFPLTFHILSHYHVNMAEAKHIFLVSVCNQMEITLESSFI